jgi:5'-3' exonuclease
MFSVSNYGQKSYTFDDQDQLDQLMRKICMDISYIIRCINPSRVIFALDSSSWRKDINIEENEGYKANREKSKNINWDNIYASLDEFSEIMEGNGYIVTRIKGGEADDTITLWNNELHMIQHQHVVIVTGDEDMRQLVSSHIHDDKPVFTTVFNPFMQGKNASRKLYIPTGFREWLNTMEEADIFNLTMDVDKEEFAKLERTEKIRFEETDGNLIKMRKIFCGDDGDNIPSIFTWLKNGKEVRFTNSKFEKMMEVLGPKCDHDELLKKSDIVLANIKSLTKETPSFNIDERLKRQIKLVALDPGVFPENIRTAFAGLKDEELKKPKTKNTHINMYELLKGTKYVTEKVQSQNKSSIFNDVDKINKIALF